MKKKTQSLIFITLVSLILLILSVLYVFSNIFILLYLIGIGIPLTILWKIKGLILLLISISIDFIFIFFHNNDFLYNILAITSILSLVIIFDYYYDSKIKSIVYQSKIMKKQRVLFIDEIIKKSQFQSIFVATISHDLRSPLNAILGFSDLLIETLKSQLDEKFMRYLKDIYDSGKELLELMDKLIDISKIDVGKLELVVEKLEIEKFIVSIINAIEPLYRNKNMKFIYEPSYHSNYIHADRLKLREILLNILTNSINFTSSNELILKISENKKNMIFELIDNGIRLNQDELDLIFQPFKKKKIMKAMDIRDLGFGLILAKRLIELHEGKINIKNNQGNGTSFSFRIPKKLKELHS